MRVRKLFVLIAALGAAAIYFIMSAVNAEIKMVHAFDAADKKVASSKADASAESADSETVKTNIKSEVSVVADSTDSAAEEKVESPETESPTIVVAPPDPSAKTDTYAKLVEPAMKSKNGTRPRLDVAFCIDTTASMQGEIDTVKAKVKSMVHKIAQSNRHPIVRVGLVAYRDNNDDYVTQVFPFSENIDSVVREISGLRAEGGGDRPEAVDRGLHAAINELQWNKSKTTAKLLFLIGDAPPHVPQLCTIEATEAIARGININTIGCDGLDSDNGISVFKEIALATNGNFETLSYHQQIADTKGNAATLITSGGKTYVMKSTDKEAWKTDIGTLVAKGEAAPALQGATNGTISVQGSDMTYVTGVNTAGTVRDVNNLDSVMVKGAEAAMKKLVF